MAGDPRFFEHVVGQETSASAANPRSAAYAVGAGRRDFRSRLGSIMVAVAVMSLSACGGGGRGDTERFCDGAADQIGAFRDARGGEVSPTIIGTLRELALEAPEELIDDFETVSSASSDQEMDAALDNIETFLVEKCGLEVRS